MKKISLIIFAILVLILILCIFVYIKEVSTSKIYNREINEKIEFLEIEVDAVDLIIKQGETLKIETDNKYIKIKKDNFRLHIEEKNHFIKTNHNNLIIYIPESYSFDIVKIEAGVGKIDIYNLVSNNVEFDFGVGDVEINNLTVNNKVDIETGVGNVEILAGILNNLNLETGVGKVHLSTKLIGNSKIESGIGEINLDLLQSIKSYKFIVTDGISSTKLNGENINTNIYGNGNNIITIDGGIGKININTYD